MNVDSKPGILSPGLYLDVFCIIVKYGLFKLVLFFFVTGAFGPGGFMINVIEAVVRAVNTFSSR